MLPVSSNFCFPQFMFLSLFFFLAFSQPPSNTWQVTRLFYSPNCSMQVGTFANVYVRRPCDASKPPSTCQNEFGTAYQIDSCESNPSMWGIFGMQSWIGSTIDCQDNVVVGSDLYMEMEWTYSAMFHNCQNSTSVYGNSSSRVSYLYQCDANYKYLVLSAFKSEDCSGTAITQRMIPVGCGVEGNRAVLISPKFCEWFHSKKKLPHAVVKPELLSSSSKTENLISLLESLKGSKR